MRPLDANEEGPMSSNLVMPSTEHCRWCEIDITLAARSGGSALITATPDDALAITKMIAGQGHGDRPGDILTCDPLMGDDVVAAMSDGRLNARSGSQATILLIREVQTLTPSGQAAVLNRLAECRASPFAHTARILASSSVDLFDLVEEGTFDERLFYCLNAIHIIGVRPSDEKAS
jgi:hypothetical protein